MKLKSVLEITITEAYNVDLNGWNFTLIYGERNRNGFIAIPDWGICVEASSPDDVFYNSEQLGACKNEIVSQNAKGLAKAVKELYS